MSNRNRLIPMKGYESLAEARRSTREGSLAALEVQLDLLKWYGTSESLQYCQAFMAQYGYKKVEHEVQRKAMGAVLRQQVGDLLERAPTYFVSHDMTEMVKQAAEAMLPEGLSPVDIPSPSGFIMFDHPIEITGYETSTETLDTDVVDETLYDGGRNTKAIPLSGFAWRDSTSTDPETGESLPGLTYWLFLRPEDAAQYDLGVMNTPDMRKKVGPLPLYDFSGWIYGRPWNTVDSDETVEGTLDSEGRFLVAPVVDSTRRVLLTVFKMLQQTIVTLGTERPYRALKRRCAAYMPEVGDVLVIQLRKEYHPAKKYTEEHGGDDVEFEGPWYSHRFLVRGHWKRQRFGENRGETKIIWVAPYVKGPEDRPLIMKDRIYSLEK